MPARSGDALAAAGDAVTHLATGLGAVDLVWRGAELVGVRLGPRLEGASAPAVSGQRPPGPAARALVKQLVAYFAGDAVAFEGPLAPSAGTPFQRRVWSALRQIPHGRWCTYGEVAAALGLPAGAARAVGGACGRNPLPIVVPCHRVVAANGGLTGFSAGVEWKKALLALEGVPLRDGRVCRDRL